MLGRVKLFNQSVALSPESAERIVRELEDLRVCINNNLVLFTGIGEFLKMSRQKGDQHHEMTAIQQLQEYSETVPPRIQEKVDRAIMDIHTTLGFELPEGVRNIWTAARYKPRLGGSSAEPTSGA